MQTDLDRIEKALLVVGLLALSIAVILGVGCAHQEKPKKVYMGVERYNSIDEREESIHRASTYCNPQTVHILHERDGNISFVCK